MFKLCVFTRALRVKNLTYAAMNGAIRVIYVGVSVHIHVNFVIKLSVLREI